MEIFEMLNYIISDLTWINMMLGLFTAIAGVAAYGLYHKLKKLEKDFDDMYYILMDIDDRLNED